MLIYTLTVSRHQFLIALSRVLRRKLQLCCVKHAVWHYYAPFSVACEEDTRVHLGACSLLGHPLHDNLWCKVLKNYLKIQLQWIHFSWFCNFHFYPPGHRVVLCDFFSIFMFHTILTSSENTFHIDHICKSHRTPLTRHSLPVLLYCVFLSSSEHYSIFCWCVVCTRALCCLSFSLYSFESHALWVQNLCPSFPGTRTGQVCCRQRSSYSEIICKATRQPILFSNGPFLRQHLICIEDIAYPNKSLLRKTRPLRHSRCQ